MGLRAVATCVAADCVAARVRWAGRLAVGARFGPEYEEKVVGVVGGGVAVCRAVQRWWWRVVEEGGVDVGDKEQSCHAEAASRALR